MVLVDMTKEQLHYIATLPTKGRRDALKGLTCQICKVKPARNVLLPSTLLCCVDRATRCPGQPTADDMCYGCGIPATTKTKLGFVCGSHPWDGCQKLFDERMVHKTATFNERMQDDDLRKQRQHKHEKTMMERYGVRASVSLPSWKAAIQEKYGVENPAQAEEVKKLKVSNSLERHGVEHPSQLETTKEAYRKTCQERYGVDNVVQSKELRKEWETAYIERHGVRHPMMVPEHKQHHHEIHQNKHGGDSPFCDSTIQKQRVETLIEKYGVDNPWKSPQVILARKEMWLEKYGVDNPASLEETIAKIQQTNLNRYGVKYPISNPEVYRSIYLPGFYRNHTMTLPSGRVVSYQGYEHPAINFLLESFPEDDLLMNGELSFSYIDLEGDKHTYYPDLGVRSKQTAIEVKSPYTFACALADGTLVQKLLAVQSHGWLPVVQVWDDDKLLETLLLDEILGM